MMVVKAGWSGQILLVETHFVGRDELLVKIEVAIKTEVAKSR